MKPWISYAVLSALLAFYTSCNAEDSDSVITIGTFNVEWLGDGDSLDVKQRTDEDYRNIAEIIKKTDAEVLGIQEIENSAALEKVLRYLPEYKYYLGTHGHAQNVGVLYKSSVQISDATEYLPLATRAERNRPGFVFRCTKNQFSATVMVVHLKSTSRMDSTKELKVESYINRREQVHVLRTWLDSLVLNAHQEDVLVVGDFNDFAQRQQNATLGEILADTNAVLLSAEQRSCKKPEWYGIDHILASRHLSQRWYAQSIHNVNLYALLKSTEAIGVSDHCPVVTQFDCKKKADLK